MPEGETKPLDREAVAALLGASDPGTVTRYLTASKEGGRYESNPFPPPDGFLGGRSPYWLASRAEEIVAWAAARPGRGAGGGRPRKDASA